MWTQNWQVRMSNEMGMRTSANTLLCKKDAMCNVDAELKGVYALRTAMNGVRQRTVLQEQYYVQCGRRAGGRVLRTPSLNATIRAHFKRYAS